MSRLVTNNLKMVTYEIQLGLVGAALTTTS